MGWGLEWECLLPSNSNIDTLLKYKEECFGRWLTEAYLMVAEWIVWYNLKSIMSFAIVYLPNFMPTNQFFWLSFRFSLYIKIILIKTLSILRKQWLLEYLEFHLWYKDYIKMQWVVSSQLKSKVHCEMINTETISKNVMKYQK